MHSNSDASYGDDGKMSFGIISNWSIKHGICKYYTPATVEATQHGADGAYCLHFTASSNTSVRIRRLFVY